METKLKPFDLEAAKNGAKVVTRDGRDARILCFDAMGSYPIVAIVRSDYEEVVDKFCLDGKNRLCGESEIDLFMAPVKREGWVNLYRKKEDNVMFFGSKFPYGTKEEAKNHATEDEEFIATAKVEWEE